MLYIYDMIDRLIIEHDEVTYSIEHTSRNIIPKQQKEITNVLTSVTTEIETSSQSNKRKLSMC